MVHCSRSYHCNLGQVSQLGLQAAWVNPPDRHTRTWLLSRILVKEGKKTKSRTCKWCLHFSEYNSAASVGNTAITTEPHCFVPKLKLLKRALWCWVALLLRAALTYIMQNWDSSYGLSQTPPPNCAPLTAKTCLSVCLPAPTSPPKE